MRDLNRLINRMLGENAVINREIRRKHILEHLKDGRMDDADREFLENTEFCQKRERANELGKKLHEMDLTEEIRRAMDDYVSAVEVEWLCYGELAYRYGLEDMLTILKQ